MPAGLVQQLVVLALLVLVVAEELHSSPEVLHTQPLDHRILPLGYRLVVAVVVLDRILLLPFSLLVAQSQTGSLEGSWRST